MNTLIVNIQGLSAIGIRTQIPIMQYIEIIIFFCPSALSKYFTLVKVLDKIRIILSHRTLMGPLHKGSCLLIPYFNSSYPCTKPISIANQTFLSLPCHKKSPCFVRGVAYSASSRLNVGVKCTHRLESALWQSSPFWSELEVQNLQ